MRKSRLTGSITLAMLLFVGAFMVACGQKGSEPTEPSSQTQQLRVMSFNIEWGGTHVSFDNVIEAIRLSGADIVGIQEAEGNLRRLAGELGWFYDERNYVISRFPLIDPPGADGFYVLVETRPDEVVAIANVHLPSDPYGPDLVRDGGSLADVLALERQVRLPWITPYLDVLPALPAAGIPLFLTGDFNSPPFTDWTEVMVGARPFLNYAVDWPVSRAVVAAGFRDSWREAHPDPRSHPGLTWWAGRPPLPEYAPGENDAQDRIDFLWFAGPAEVINSELVGEENGPGVTISVMPWPSDHRGVVSAFSVAPAAVPQFLTSSLRVYREGETPTLTFNTPEAAELNVVRIDANGQEQVVSSGTVDGRGAKELAGLAVQVGHYRADLVGENVRMQREFWILAANAVPEVTVTPRAYAVGEAIPVSWRNAPGYRNDYIAAFAVDGGDNLEDGQAWTYVKSMPNGELILDDNNAEWGWPLSPGDYVIRLMKDDGYESLAVSEVFTVE